MRDIPDPLVFPFEQVLELYTQQLAQRGVATAQEVATWQQEAVQHFETELAACRAGEYNVSAAQWLGSTWQGDALQARLFVWIAPQP